MYVKLTFQWNNICIFLFLLKTALFKIQDDLKLAILSKMILIILSSYMISPELRSEATQLPNL